MRLNGNSYENLKFNSIYENKEHEWSHDCIRIDTNVTFTHNSEKKEIQLFKDHIVAIIVKEYIRI